MKWLYAIIALLCTALTAENSAAQTPPGIITNYTFPPHNYPPDSFPIPKGDTLRARRSIQHPYTGTNFKVVLGYIEKDTVDYTELIDNESVGLRVLPLERGCVIDSFKMLTTAPHSDCTYFPHTIGNHLPRIHMMDDNWWHRRNNRLLIIEHIEGHRISDGKKMYFPPLTLHVIERGTH